MVYFASLPTSKLLPASLFLSLENQGGLVLYSLTTGNQTNQIYLGSWRGIDIHVMFLCQTQKIATNANKINADTVYGY